MNTENTKDFLKNENEQTKTDQRRCKLNYIQKHRVILKPLVNAYRSLPKMKELLQKREVVNETEMTVFSAFKEQFDRLASIDLSLVSATILLEIRKKAVYDTYEQGMPVQFVARCKMAYSGNNCPMAIVSDPYANMSVSFPYHATDEKPVIPGKYYLFSALIKNGEFLVMQAKALKLPAPESKD